MACHGSHAGILSYQGIFSNLGFIFILNSFSKGCNKTLTGVNGTFNSPIYRTEEPVVLYCSWRIKVAPAQQILVTFTNFNLQSAANNDSLLVYDGKDATREVLGVFYKGRPPPKEGINSSSNHMVLVFKSINHTKYTGFVASYFAIKNSGRKWTK